MLIPIPSSVVSELLPRVFQIPTALSSFHNGTGLNANNRVRPQETFERSPDTRSFAEGTTRHQKGKWRANEPDWISTGKNTRRCSHTRAMDDCQFRTLTTWLSNNDLQHSTRSLQFPGSASDKARSFQRCDQNGRRSGVLRAHALSC